MARPSKIALPFTKSTVAKGNRYYYFDTGKQDDRGKKIFKRLPDPSDKAKFGEAYATLLGHRNRAGSLHQAMTVKGMIVLYQKSPQWGKLADGTRKLYTIYLGELDRLMGQAPVDDVKRDDIVLMIDKRADKPGAANMLLKITQALYKWGRGRGHTSANPCLDIETFEIGEHEPWPEWLIEKALVSDDDRVRMLVHLLYFTAQRIGDVSRIKFTDIRDGVLYVRQEKTKAEMEIPIHSRLQAEIARAGRHFGPVLIGHHGRAMRSDSLRRDLQEWAQGHGEKIVAHGLRKNAVNALLEAGCSVTQTASISGQTIQMVEHYAKRRNRGKLAKEAMAKWERTNGDSSN